MESTAKNDRRIPVPANDEIPGESKGILGAAEKMMGFVPNVLKILAVSPEVLTSFLTLQDNLSKTLDLKTRTAIALAISEVNGCHYCLSAHSFFASKAANVKNDEIELNRKGKSQNVKVQAAATFAAEVLRKRGKVTESEFAEVREAGYSDKEILEIIAVAVQISFTNFINNAVKTDIDFDIVTAPGTLA